MKIYFKVIEPKNKKLNYEKNCQKQSNKWDSRHKNKVVVKYVFTKSKKTFTIFINLPSLFPVGK
jgi:hypothetical protein